MRQCYSFVTPLRLKVLDILTMTIQSPSIRLELMINALPATGTRLLCDIPHAVAPLKYVGPPE